MNSSFTKLNLIGISGNLIYWFHSYLLNCSQQVLVNGHLSSQTCVSSGEPPGGHLSPWLFLVFLFDIDICFKFCKLKLFADDLKLYYTISRIENCLLLQDDLNRLSIWCNKFFLTLNAKKCSKVSFHRNKSKISFNYYIDNNTLPEYDNIKDLGITFQSNPQFSTHINQICLKAIKTLGFLCRSTKLFDNINCLRVLYCVIVRPILENGSIIWNPNTIYYIQKLERIQRKFIRFIGFKRRLTNNIDDIPIQSLQFNLKLDLLLAHRNMSDISFLYKLINDIISCFWNVFLFTYPNTIPALALHSILKHIALIMDRIILLTDS
jgi:hypothetical protein